MDVKASDILGRYQIKLNEVRKVIATLVGKGGDEQVLAPARSEAADLQANYNILLLKYRNVTLPYIDNGIDGFIQLNELETALVESIDNLYEDIANIVRPYAS